VGRRSRSRGREEARSTARAPETAVEREGHVLRLRGTMTVGTRSQYAAIGGAREDAWQRRVEFLFERLVAGWEIAGIEVPRRDLLARFRLASSEERRLIRDVLRDHVAEHFPDVEAP
jgi:hypothetical protein